MPSTDDWINTPLNSIAGVFDPKIPSEAVIRKVEEYFATKLKSEESLSWVPSLNTTSLHSLKTNTLVRFRCMIQEQLEPEYYHGIYEVRNKDTDECTLLCGMFKDLANCKPNEELLADSKNSVLMDRQSLYCVPVPGETAWVKQAYADAYPTLPAQSTSYSQSRSKRPLTDDPVEEGTTSGDVTMDTDQDRASAEPSSSHTSTETSAKRSCTGTASSSGTSEAEIRLLNFPLPNESGPACIVKIYSKEDERFKLNEVYEFIGVLSNDPAMVNFPEKSDASDLGSLLGDTVEQRTPSSLVPRLHCVIAKRLKHVNPLCSDEQETSELLKEAAAIREQLVTVLQQALYGDKIAADYLLCHLISSVYRRHECDPVGKFCLNLTNCPKGSFTKKLGLLIESLVTKCFFMEMSLSNMNKYSFIPKKDVENNRLNSGILQLSDHTHLILDHTCMETGQLNMQGLLALQGLIQWQKVQYDFPFSPLEFPLDSPVLVLSEGKALLPSDVSLPLSGADSTANVDDTFQAISDYLTPILLTKIRHYLTAAQMAECEIPSDMQKHIEDDFVRIRKRDPEIKGEQLHRLITIARYLSVSHGLKSVTIDHWEHAKNMEMSCKARGKTANGAAA